MSAGSYLDLDADHPGAREHENDVRLLFVEHSPEYGALVRETLDRATRGRPATLFRLVIPYAALWAKMPSIQTIL